MDKHAVKNAYPKTLQQYMDNEATPTSLLSQLEKNAESLLGLSTYLRTSASVLATTPKCFLSLVETDCVCEDDLKKANSAEESLQVFVEKHLAGMNDELGIVSCDSLMDDVAPPITPSEMCHH